MAILLPKYTIKLKTLLIDFKEDLNLRKKRKRVREKENERELPFMVAFGVILSPIALPGANPHFYNLIEAADWMIAPPWLGMISSSPSSPTELIFLIIINPNWFIDIK